MDIANVLAATLNPDSTTRISAELKLAELFAVPGGLDGVKDQFLLSNHLARRCPETGLALSQLALAQDAELSLRQISLA